MSQSERTERSGNHGPSDTAGSSAVESEASRPDDQPSASAETPESTVGTGSVFAIGCTLFAMLVVLVGIALIFMRG